MSYSNYPDGTGPNDPDAPWNQREPTCSCGDPMPEPGYACAGCRLIFDDEGESWDVDELGTNVAVAAEDAFEEFGDRELSEAWEKEGSAIVAEWLVRRGTAKAAADLSP